MAILILGLECYKCNGENASCDKKNTQICINSGNNVCFYIEAGKNSEKIDL